MTENDSQKLEEKTEENLGVPSPAGPEDFGGTDEGSHLHIEPRDTEPPPPAGTWSEPGTEELPPNSVPPTVPDIAPPPAVVAAPPPPPPPPEPEPVKPSWIHQFAAFRAEAIEELLSVARLGLTELEVVALQALATRLIVVAMKHDPNSLDAVIAAVEQET